MHLLASFRAVPEQIKIQEVDETTISTVLALAVKLPEQK